MGQQPAFQKLNFAFSSTSPSNPSMQLFQRLLWSFFVSVTIDRRCHRDSKAMLALPDLPILQRDIGTGSRNMRIIKCAPRIDDL